MSAEEFIQEIQTLIDSRAVDCQVKLTHFFVES